MLMGANGRRKGKGKQRTISQIAASNSGGFHPSSVSPRLKALRQASSRGSVYRDSGAGEPGSLIGGISSSSIRAKVSYNSTPLTEESTGIRKRSGWHPPERDTSRFSGTSSSRHRASSRNKDPEVFAPSWDSLKDWEESSKKEKTKSSTKAKQGKKKQGKSAAPKPAKKAIVAKPQSVLRTDPFSRKELKALDNNYRLFGGQPDWRGWNRLFPDRSVEFIFMAAKQAGFDQPVSDWTKGERAVFRDNHKSLTPESPEWRKLLPRKSEAMIAEQYALRQRATWVKNR